MRNIKKMGAVYKSICFEADSLLLCATRLVEKEITLKVEIESLMNTGFVNIAKARYIMGSTCVTKMQLPSQNSNPIKALATVCRKEVNNSWVFEVNRKKYLKTNELNGEVSEETFENLGGESSSRNSSNTCMSTTSKSEAAFKHILQTDPKSLKKSKKAFLVGDDLYQEYNDELLDEMSNTDSNESLVSVTNPIRLFGILVPNALKEAQVIFNDVVDLLGECATVQFELRETVEKLKHLHKVKCLIEAASMEMKLNILSPRVYWTPSETSSVSCHSLKTEEEGEEESDTESDTTNVSIQKSIRSVFFDNKDTEAQELSLWGSERSIKTNFETTDN